MKILFLIITLTYGLTTIAGTTYINATNPAQLIPDVDGVFVCGGDSGEGLSTKAKPFSCEVTDRTKETCRGFFTNACPPVSYSYPEYAKFRAERENQKIEYKGLAPAFVGRDSKFTVLVFVKIIPQ